MIKNRVSIILVTFNSARTLEPLLKSILCLDCKDLELLIVDNKSNDVSLRIIDEILPELNKKLTLRLFRLDENIGFCSAANLAIQESSGEFLCIIDHDIEMTPSVIEELVYNLELNPTVGSVQPKVINANDKRFIDSYDINESGAIRGMDATLYRNSRKILYCIGACLVTRIKTFQEAGGFYNDFFVEKHDMDFGWRLWLLGYSNKTVPSAEIYHNRGTLRKGQQVNLMFEYHGFKNDLVMVIQNFETKNVPKYLLRFAPIPFFNILRNPVRGYIQAKSAFWVVCHLKLIMKRRYFIQSSRRVADDELVGMLEHIFPPSLTENLKSFVN